MSGLSITGQMKVATLKRSFLKEFGLTLRIYDGRSFADQTQTLAQVRKNKGSGKALSVAKNMKVGNLEDKFEKEFGLKVQVAGSNDSYLCKNELTLNAAQKEDEKKLARKGRKAARQAEVRDESDDEVKDEDGNSQVNFIELSFKCLGGEFQYHRLNKEDSEYLKKEYETDKEDFLNMNLNGGESFDDTIWDGSYGPSLHDIELVNEEDGKPVDISEAEMEQEFYTDGEDDQQANCLDFFYVTEGKVFGNIVVPVPEGDDFNPAKLVLKFVEYNLDGYPERYGKILHEVEYDGEYCELNVEDNGTDVFRSLIGYDMEDGELHDYFIVHDTVHHPEWNWNVIEKVFKLDPDDDNNEEEFEF